MKTNRKRFLTATLLEAYTINNDLLDLYDIIDSMLPEFEAKMQSLKDAHEYLKKDGQLKEAQNAAAAFKKASKVIRDLEDLAGTVDVIALNVL